jgi:hypothetical protein
VETKQKVRYLDLLLHGIRKRPYVHSTAAAAAAAAVEPHSSSGNSKRTAGATVPATVPAQQLVHIITWRIRIASLLLLS